MNSFGKLVDKFVDNTNWKLSKSTLYFKRLVWIPVCTERNGTLFIYLSKQIRKEVILLLKLLDEKDEFYFMSPIFSNPKYKYIDEDFHKLNDWMLSCFEEEGCGIDLVLASTLDPTDKNASSREKSFRKPAPGMLLAAQEILELDLQNSLLIGDRESDIEAGFNAGIGNLFLVNPEVVLGGNHESFNSLHECLVRLKEIF